MTGPSQTVGDLLRQAMQVGDLRQASTLYRRVLALQPDSIDAHMGHLAILWQLRRSAETATGIDRVLALDPSHADALNNRGVILLQLGRAEPALAAFDHVLARTGPDPDLLSNRAAALLALKRWDAALASADRALGLAPVHADALNNRANALKELGRADEALKGYDSVLAVAPAHVEALSNRAAVLRDMRRLHQALASARHALTLDPSHAKAFNNCGNVLKHLAGDSHAQASYSRALAIHPRYVEALANRANAWAALGQPDRAERDFNALLAIDPDAPYAESLRLHAQMRRCDWTRLRERTERVVASVEARKPAATPFVFFSLSDSAADQLICAESFCRRHYPASPAPLWRGETYRHDRIRVAYLSADFRDHAIAHLLAGLFEHHDRSRFETIALSFGPDDASAMRRRLERAFDRFIDVRANSDREIAELVRSFEVDIAVDLMGHTESSRLGIFAQRPAPTSVNFFCPTGAAFIDYLIADPVVVPPDHHRFHRERIVTLPDSFLATDRSRAIAASTPSRRELGLPEQAVVFCCFNNAYKLNPAMFDVWMRLLRDVPGSVLWLQQVGHGGAEALRREAASRGVDGGRLVLAPRVPSTADHLARYRRADLFLDTLPFNAHTTAADALWAGLPVLTCTGSTFVGRVAASLLAAIGLPELAAGSLDDYETRARELARDRTRLATIRTRLAANRDTHPLFDTERYTLHVEQAYDGMRERAARGQAPESFSVPA